MKKITLLLFCFVSLSGFSQSKSTGNITLDTNMTANLTLNNATSKVTLVLKGPTDRWFAMGLGVAEGFSMGDGDVLIYTNALSDRNYIGKQAPAIDSSQDWVTVSNTTDGAGVRTLTLERSLTNSDSNDFQLPYASTNSIDLAWARDPIADFVVSNHQSNRGFASGTFTTLGVEDFSLNATSIYPNPASGEFFIKTKTSLSKVKLYSQTGALVKTIDVIDDAREFTVDVKGVQSGVYLLELQNDSETSWKKVIVN